MMCMYLFFSRNIKIFFFLTSKKFSILIILENNLDYSSFKTGKNGNSFYLHTLLNYEQSIIHKRYDKNKILTVCLIM